VSDHDGVSAPDTRAWSWRVGAVIATLVVVWLLVTTGDGIEVETAAPETVPETAPETVPPTGTSEPRPTSTSAAASTSTSGPSSTSTTVPATVPLATIDIDEEYDDTIEIDEDNPAVAGRGLPDELPENEPPPSTIAPPPWAASTLRTKGGHVSTDVGCARSTSVQDLDQFFAQRVGPVLGWDYQHIYPLGGNRYLWLFQDAFVDHSGVINSFDKSRFVHNAALIQEGSCFRLLHRGTAAKPEPFEIGDGRSQTRSTWWWPMGGELVDGRIWVFWAEMLKDPYDPAPPDGLGWHPVRTWLASYDATTMERITFGPAPNQSATPIYGYAVSSDPTHTYLFGNTFEQNLVREGGFWQRGHSAKRMWLARVPRGQVWAAPEYRTADGWSPDPAAAVPIVDRFFVENPMQPRYMDGQWVSATAVDGYWGDEIAIDVAADPWGPWHTVHFAPLRPRGLDPKMNTYHAHLLPWRDRFGSVLVSVSNNARNMRRDAWFAPHRYRPTFVHFQYTPVPTTTTTTTTTTTLPPSTTSPDTSTTLAPTTTTTLAPTTTTSTSTTTTVPPSTTTSSTSTTTTSVAATPTSTTSIAPAGDGG
jgi:hypothetical protein